MEMFGIILSLPFFFIVSVAYSIIARKLFKSFPKLSNIILWPSVILLALLLLELFLVFVISPKVLENSLGIVFALTNIATLILAIPSLANILILQNKFPVLSKWFIIGPGCTALTLVTLLFQLYFSVTLDPDVLNP